MIDNLHTYLPTLEEEYLLFSIEFIYLKVYLYDLFNLKFINLEKY
jgi:hypothetical protein